MASDNRRLDQASLNILASSGQASTHPLFSPHHQLGMIAQKGFTSKYRHGYA